MQVASWSAGTAPAAAPSASIHDLAASIQKGLSTEAPKTTTVAEMQHELKGLKRNLDSTNCDEGGAGLEGEAPAKKGKGKGSAKKGKGKAPANKGKAPAHGVVEAKAPAKGKAPEKGKAQEKSKGKDNGKPCKGLLPFPGMPKKATEKVRFKHFTLYTDLNAGCWRLMRDGEKKDQKANFRMDARKGWDRVNEILRIG